MPPIPLAMALIAIKKVMKVMRMYFASILVMQDVAKNLPTVKIP